MVTAKCAKCGRIWNDPVELVRDRELVLNGYLPVLTQPELGLFQLTHARDGCYSTIAVRAGFFRDLVKQEFDTLLYGTEACELRCENPEDFTPCGQRCLAAWVREVLAMLHRHEIPDQNAI
jgi:hypothetical protein